MVRWDSVQRLLFCDARMKLGKKNAFAKDWDISASTASTAYITQQARQTVTCHV